MIVIVGSELGLSLKQSGLGGRLALGLNMLYLGLVQLGQYFYLIHFQPYGLPSFKTRF